MKKETTEEKLSYRIAMLVTESVCYQSGFKYPICPRFKCSMEREVQSYCDRCGQKLNWKHYSLKRKRRAVM